jgi:hypothetical protein
MISSLDFLSPEPGGPENSSWQETPLIEPSRRIVPR